MLHNIHVLKERASPTPTCSTCATCTTADDPKPPEVLLNVYGAKLDLNPVPHALPPACPPHPVHMSPLMMRFMTWMLSASGRLHRGGPITRPGLSATMLHLDGGGGVGGGGGEERQGQGSWHV